MTPEPLNLSEDDQARRLVSPRSESLYLLLTPGGGQTPPVRTSVMEDALLLLLLLHLKRPC